jgi:hypothetical protein
MLPFVGRSQPVGKTPHFLVLALCLLLQGQSGDWLQKHGENSTALWRAKVGGLFLRIGNN